MLKDYARKYYIDLNYNCAETMLRAANEFYDLGISEHDMRMVSGFGAGMQSGSTCGTLLACISIISMKYVETKAHESKDLRPICSLLTRKFEERWKSTLCSEIKPQTFEPQIRCLHTVEDACDMLEETFKEYEEKELLF